jgi:uncharacterized protein (DUF2235 family)
MSKAILIFADGTGQIGGLKPDQRLSNVYKMYRAMRPGPQSPIKPDEQVAFYDPGLGSAEARPFTPGHVRKIFEAGLGTGLDANVIDCYAAIIANYRPGDLICLFGFSRGAYTARALANVLNLCGVPTHDAAGRPVPRHGPKLREIAAIAVRKVYNHGAGSARSAYETEREKLAERFRKTFGSEGKGADGEGQGNVQPHFIGVFDTVAALRSNTAAFIVLAAFTLLVWTGVWISQFAPFWAQALGTLFALWLLWHFIRDYLPLKFFIPDSVVNLPKWHPRRWLSGVWHTHIAWWSGKHYDRYVDREVGYLRHAISIDEDRKKFPRVGWGFGADVTWNEKRGKQDWLKQWWFAGNHSDIGGSYPEDESRLSDIALKWMVDELRAVMGKRIQIVEDRLVTSPDALGLQHSERTSVLDMQPAWLRWLTANRLTWVNQTRTMMDEAFLHPTVLDRLAAPAVPQMGEVKPYRPEALRNHVQARGYF